MTPLALIRFLASAGRALRADERPVLLAHEVCHLRHRHPACTPCV